MIIKLILYIQRKFHSTIRWNFLISSHHGWDEWLSSPRAYLFFRYFLLYSAQCVSLEHLGVSVSPSLMAHSGLSDHGHKDDIGTKRFLLKKSAEELCKKCGKKTQDMNWQSEKCNSDKDEEFWHKWQPIHLWCFRLQVKGKILYHEESAEATMRQGYHPTKMTKQNKMYHIFKDWYLIPADERQKHCML